MSEDAELDLVVRFHGAAGDQHFVVWAYHAVGCLQEDHRLDGRLGVRLVCVVEVVQPDAHNLAGSSDGRTEAMGTFDWAQCSCIKRDAQRSEAAVPERRVVVADHLGGVEQSAVLAKTTAARVPVRRFGPVS